MRKTVTSFIVASLLIISLKFFSLTIQINQSFNTSFSFGSEKILEDLSLPNDFFIAQNMAVRLWGNVNSNFYVYGELQNTNVDTFMVEYLPWNMQIGTVQLNVAGTFPFSIVGISSPNFSFGQLRGYRKILNFTVECPNQIFTIGSVAFGSVNVYLNGVLLSSSEYNLNYKDGILSVPSAVPSDVVSVEYQSLTNACPLYALNFNKAFALSKERFELGAAAFSSSATNTQLFIFSKVKSGKIALSSWLNVEKNLSFKVKFSRKFHFLGTNNVLDFYYNSQNFRKPMGIPQQTNLGFDLSCANNFGKMKMSSDLNEMNVSFKQNDSNLFLKVGKNDNLIFRASNKNVRAGLNLKKGVFTTFEEIKMGNVSAYFFQDNFLKKYIATFSLSNPISFEASISSSSVGLKLSKDFGLIGFSSSFQKNVDATDETFNFKVNGNFGNSKWKANFQSKPEKKSFAISSQIPIFNYELNVSVASSGVSFAFNGKDFSIETNLEKDGVKIHGSFTAAIGQWQDGVYLTIAAQDGKMAGAISFKLWRNEF